MKELAPWQLELKTWVNDYRQRTDSSFSGVAKELDLPRESLSDYITDPKVLERIDPARRMMLYRKTGIEALKVEGYEPQGREGRKKYESPQITEDLAERFLTAYKQFVEHLPEHLRNSILALQSQPTSEQRMGHVTSLFYALGHELDGFKSAYPDDFARLRDVLNPRDVGYVTTLLNLIFKDERVLKWQLETSYRFKGPQGARR